MYARFRSRPSFYKLRDPARTAYGVRPNSMRSASVKGSHVTGNPSDQSIDMRDKERLDMLEAMRHPRERDFYQDHTYHNQWINRGLDASQKRTISSRYAYMQPGYQIEPWVWYPGDMVEVASGESRGQRGTIIAVVKFKNELIVQNVNVQDVILPATETRPEQIVQREHPVSVKMVRHVDPETNEACDVRLVTVRNKETGGLEEKRISLSSGVLLPIPARDEGLDVGDPLKDTAYQDASEPTYEADAELAVLTERKLRAMEEHFVGRLKESYDYHRALSAKNEEEMRKFQKDVVQRAASSAVDALYDTLDAEWWREEVEPVVADMLEADAQRAAAAESSASVAPTEEEGDDEEDEEGDEENDDELLADTADVSAPTPTEEDTRSRKP
jgi:large subunit ribosomal protein L24